MEEDQYAVKSPQYAATTQHAAPTQFTAPTQHAATAHTFSVSLRSLLVGQTPNQKNLTKTVERLISPPKATSCK